LDSQAGAADLWASLFPGPEEARQRCTAAKEIEADPGWGDQMRIVATIRGGDLHDKDKKEWYNHHAADYEIDNPYALKPAKKNQMSKMKNEVPAKAKRKSTRKTSAPKASTVTDVASSPAKEGGVLVSAAYAHLPRIGDQIIMSTSSPYGVCKVLRVYTNFVETDVVSRTGSITMKCGTQFQIRFAPKDDLVTIVNILAVGIIYGAKAGSHQYRVAVFRRKYNGDKTWGPLETLDGSAFPSPLNCKVISLSRTHAQKQKQATYTPK
jgi:hypothetical protein